MLYRARTNDPKSYRSNANVRLLSATAKLVLSTIPRDPGLTNYRIGNTMGAAYRHWFRAKFGQRFRLFFRYGGFQGQCSIEAIPHIVEQPLGESWGFASRPASRPTERRYGQFRIIPVEAIWRHRSKRPRNHGCAAFAYLFPGTPIFTHLR